jgi:hypothetical protein
VFVKALMDRFAILSTEKHLMLLIGDLRFHREIDCVHKILTQLEETSPIKLNCIIRVVRVVASPESRALRGWVYDAKKDTDPTECDLDMLDPPSRRVKAMDLQYGETTGVIERDLSQVAERNRGRNLARVALSYRSEFVPDRSDSPPPLEEATPVRVICGYTHVNNNGNDLAEYKIRVDATVEAMWDLHLNGPRAQH